MLHHDVPYAVLKTNTFHNIVVPQRAAFRRLEELPEFREAALSEERVESCEDGKHGWERVGLVVVRLRGPLAKERDAEVEVWEGECGESLDEDVDDYV